MAQLVTGFNFTVSDHYWTTLDGICSFILFQRLICHYCRIVKVVDVKRQFSLSSKKTRRPFRTAVTQNAANLNLKDALPPRVTDRCQPQSD